MKNPRRDVPLSLALGTGIVMTLYLAANVTYFVTLPTLAVETAPADQIVAEASCNNHGSKGTTKHKIVVK